ncbi:MAG: family 10 glycosylhydrolase [Bryobacteraceae bacterium]
MSFLLLSAGMLAAQQYRGFWADAFHKGYKNPAEVDQMVDDVVASRANAIFVEVRHRGGSYYLKSLEPPVEDAEYTQGFDALQYLIERAHARGIEVHAWFPVTPLWPFARPPVDPRHVWHAHGPQAQGDQMWMTVSAAGGVSTSVDPGHPDALQYLAGVIIEPARHYNLDGLHLDYIRYPEDANYGWNPLAAERFRRLENRTGTPAASDPRWSEFRRRQVTELVRQIYLRANAIRPSIKISAALISWGNGPLSDAEFRTKDAYTRVFQNWRGWMEEGILDLGIPMNYFREAANASFFDRWIEYEKDRQFNRGVLIGPAIYLNSIPESMAQLRRALAPSAAGNRALGVSFYSYATTNTERPGGGTTAPNAEFYKAVGEFFGDSVAVPALAWKAAPAKGHAFGRIEVDGGPRWLKDGATVLIESDTGAAIRETTSDGSGFFGAVDLAPGRYRVRMERGGRELFRSTPFQVNAGATVEFPIRLKADDFTPALPREVEGPTAAAPGEIISIGGKALAGEFAGATAVPLPVELGRTQVVVNGQAVPLFAAAPDRIDLQLPYGPAESWQIVVKHAGMESTPVTLRAVVANPAILAVVAREDGYLEIYATGLGPVDPPLAAGIGADPGLPLPRTLLRVAVVLRSAGGETTLSPLYSGLAPYQPGRYQVNVRLPDGVESGEVLIRAAGLDSPPANFTRR